jgi:hypothetical protein
MFVIFCAKSNFKMQWCQYSDSVYFSEHVKIRMKKKIFIPALLLLEWCDAFSSINV